MDTRKFMALALVAALAGCLGAGVDDGSPTTNDAAGGADAGGAAAVGGGEEAAAPLALFLGADGALHAEPPAAGWLAYPEAVNSPFGTESAVWTGTLPRAVNLTGDVPIVLHVTSSSANAAARTMPIFDGLPGFFVRLDVGETVLRGALDGPTTVTQAEVAEAAGALAIDGDTPGGLVPAGSPVTLTVQAAYVHAMGAAELRFVVGAEHPAGVVLG